MLGWEFPPVLTGGLGTACYGLCKNLSNYADITLLIPRSESKDQLENVKILGMNYVGLDPEIKFDTQPAYETFVTRVEYIPGDFNPYPTYTGYYREFQEKAVIPVEDNSEAVRWLYSTDEPYGANIMEKVAVFEKIATAVALNHDFDVIHAHDWITYPAALRIKQMTGKPLVMHIHSLETDRVGPHAKYQENAVYDIERNGMQHADLLMPVSQYTAQCAMEHYGIWPGKFRPVHNGIDPSETFRIEKKPGEKIVLFLGRITYQKGPEFMAETAFKLLKKFSNVKFFVAGKGDQLEKLKQLTADAGIGDKFHFAGFLNKKQVEEILAQTDVYFMPSVSEPFGLSALEAAQFGNPVVLSAQSGVAEVLPHSLKADYWDTDRFANYIYALLNYDGIRDELTTHTLEDLDEITWDDSAKMVYRVYQEALNRA